MSKNPAGKILVADDEKAIRMMLRDMLSIDGYTVYEAANGQEAIEKFEEVRPDLVLLDGMMPVMSGFEACKEITANDPTPVLMFTALEDTKAVDMAFEAGATDYITKPIRWPLLRHRVKRLVESYQAEETLHYTRAILENVIASTPVFLFAVDRDGIFTLVEGRFPFKSGQVGQSFFELYRDEPRMVNDMERVLNGDAFHSLYKLEKRMIQMRYTPLHAPSGDIIGATVAGMETGESSWKDEALARERNLLRILIDNLPDYVFVKDTEGHFVVTNMANTRYLGAKRPQEVIGRTDFDFFPPERAHAYWQRDMEIMQSGSEPQTWEQTEEDLETGRKRWYAITKVPFLDAQENVLGIVGMIRDITRDKEARDEMRLANEQLIELNRLKSHFLLTMSHEFRTPLISILGYSEMLLQGIPGELNEKQRDRLERIHKNGQNLLTLIDDILDISKIHAGEMKIELQPTHLESLIQECYNGYSSTASKKGLEFEYAIDPDLPAVIGDSTSILKVLTNLTSNAIKFTARGRVKISAEQVNQADSGVLVTVEDTGIGISPENQQTLFSEFRQIDSAPTREQGGTGLGLALSHKLVSLMHGRLWLESEPGKGSKFYVLLPAARNHSHEN